MIIQCKSLQRQHPELFKAAQLVIGQVSDADKGQKYFFTFVERQGSLFGTSSVNLVLRHTSKPYGDQYTIFYEKSVELDQQGNVMPMGEASKIMRMERMKLVARQNCYLTVVFTTDKDKFQESNFRFKEAGVAEQWENLLRSKKEAAKKINLQRENLAEQLKKANVQVRTLKEQLRKERANKDNILIMMNLMTEECNRYKVLAKNLQEHVLAQDDETSKKEKEYQAIIQENTTLKQEIANLKKQIQSLQRSKLQAQLKAAQLQTQQKKAQLSYSVKVASLNKQREQLSSSMLIEEKLTSELINKVIRKNKIILQLNKRINNELQLSRSVIIDNQQDYRSFYGHQRHFFQL